METPRIVDERDMTAELDASIRQGLCLCFPKDYGIFSSTRSWHGSSPAFSAMIQQDGRVVAHVGVVDRTVHIADEPARAAGIMNVFVLPQYRGCGLSDQVMSAAMKEAAARQFDLGLLFCIQPLLKVYARTGWIAVDNPVIRTELGQDLPLPEGNQAMIFPLRLQTISTGAVLHLNGNDW